MQMIIDRFEGNMAVCEKPDRTMTNIPLSQLPAEAKEGDVLIVEGDCIRIDQIETEKRRKAAAETMKSVFKKKRS
jgi:uncharacterized Zn finger protein